MDIMSFLIFHANLKKKNNNKKEPLNLKQKYIPPHAMSTMRLVGAKSFSEPNLGENLRKIHIFSFKKMHFKILSVKWQ